MRERLCQQADAYEASSWPGSAGLTHRDAAEGVGTHPSEGKTRASSPR